MGVLALAARLPAQEVPTAQELAARIQAHYATVRDFTADFTLTQTSPLLPKAVVERGDVKIKKPGRMRWNYTTSDRQQFISDGTTMYAYFPRGRYADRIPMPARDDVSTALLFLAGRGDLTRDFVATLPESQPAGEWRVILTPRAKQAEFERLTLDVDRASLAFRGLVVVHVQGATDTFRFSNLRENRGLADSEFVFTAPRGVEIR
jgi:outer membrane lipoprotein carrier protein